MGPVRSRGRTPDRGWRSRIVLSFGVVNSISDQLFSMPQFAPVMILPQATLFPHSLLPLFIFEPRYRSMLNWTLENHRMFCVAPTQSSDGAEEFLEALPRIGGLGVVRACIANSDGTSHLILQGLARVELLSFRQRLPFPTAEIRAVNETPVDAKEGAKLVRQIRQLSAQLREQHNLQLPEDVNHQLAALDDPSVLGDLVARAFIDDASERQSLFEERDVAERLRLLIRWLEARIK